MKCLTPHSIPIDRESIATSSGYTRPCETPNLD